MAYPSTFRNAFPRRLALKRSKRKCDRCRQDRQKCLPEDRDWNENRIPCERCKEKEYNCGPSIVLPRNRPRSMRLSADTTQHDAHERHDAASNVDLSMVMMDAVPEGMSLQVTTDAHQQGQSRYGPHFSHAAIGSPLLPSGLSQRSPIHGRKDCELVCRKLLKDLGNTAALRKNIVFDMGTIEDVGQHFGFCYNTVCKALHSDSMTLLSKVDRNTLKLIRQGVELLLSDKRTFAECFLHRLKTFAIEFRSRCQSYVPYMPHKSPLIDTDWDVIDETNVLGMMMQDKIYEWRKRKDIYSDAEIICETLGGDPRFFCRPRLGSDSETNAAYIRASTDLRQVHEQLSLGDDGPPSVSGRFPYPPSLLAYRVRDPGSALRLRCDAPTSSQATDLLDRSLLHYAVNNNDIPYIQDVINTHPQAIRRAGVDAFGMSLQAIAILRDNAHMFELLLGSDTGCSIPQENIDYLSLAARVGNAQIMRKILEFRPYLHSLAKALNQAIEARHEEPAKVILRCVQDPACFNENELEEAAQKADDRLLCGLAQEIRALKPFYGHRLETVSDVSRINIESSGYTENSSTHQAMTMTSWWHGHEDFPLPILPVEDIYSSAMYPQPPNQPHTMVNQPMHFLSPFMHEPRDDL